MNNCINNWNYKRGWLAFSENKIDNELILKDFQDDQFYSLHIFFHPETKVYKKQKKDFGLYLIGHAYNPIDMIHEEDIILDSLLFSTDIVREINKLTGVFSLFVYNKGVIQIYQDACGIMPVYFGRIDNRIVISNYAQLIADIWELRMDSWISEYINSSFYTIGIRQLCGRDSAFSELKMLTANTYLSLSDLSINRFYPISPLCTTEDNYNYIKKILHNSMLCCSRKWNCAISLTGGVDSRMTLAAANGLYDKFSYFSFISNPAERKDTEAATNICNAIKVNHIIYEIPDNNEAISNFKQLKKIINHNTSEILRPKDSDIRKIITLADKMVNCVEIKSHISEVGRAFYFKKLGKKSFRTPLSARNMSNLAKRNMFNRALLKKMDRSFSEFIKETAFDEIPSGYEQTDMFYWENRMPLWGSLVKQRFDVSHETTIIYNNRLLLEAFLKFPLQQRIKDIPQKKIISDLNPILTNLVSNNNAMKSWKRIVLENLFYSINQ